MAEYEMVREIKNLCRNNQMRDIFFDDVETDDPAGYVRALLKGRAVELTAEERPDGTVTIHATVDGLMQTFQFSPIL